MLSQEHQEDAENSPLLNAFVVEDPDQLDVDLGGTEERQRLERSLLRKLDARMSFLVLIYILNYIDRNNASAARLQGFEKDLHLEGSQFATVLSVLYIGYVLMQIPSNIFLHYTGKPSIYLPCCMILWGGLSVSTGFARNFFDVLCIRFLLGFVEAAFFPGALYLLSKWYKRNELSQRTALLFSGSLISNAFGSLMASGILDLMDGAFGYTAWRWLFFIEGTLTIIVAICAIFILPDFPDSPSRWLTPAESALAQKRIAEDVIGAESAVFKGVKPAEQGYLTGLWLAFGDWKTWWLALALANFVLAVSFNAYFPTLCATMGYTPTLTLLLCVPPWIFATVAALVVSRHSDQSGERCLHITLPILLGICGFIIAMLTMNVALRYISLFLMAQTYAGFVCFLAWASSSVPYPPEKRAVALAFINCVSQTANVLGSYIWPISWGPTYNTSFAICIVACIICILMCSYLRIQLANMNKNAARLEAETGSRKGYRYML